MYPPPKECEHDNVQTVRTTLIEFIPVVSSFARLFVGLSPRRLKSGPPLVPPLTEVRVVTEIRYVFVLSRILDPGADLFWATILGADLVLAILLQ